MPFFWSSPGISFSFFSLGHVGEWTGEWKSLQPLIDVWFTLGHTDKFYYQSCAINPLLRRLRNHQLRLQGNSIDHGGWRRLLKALDFFKKAKLVRVIIWVLLDFFISLH